MAVVIVAIAIGMIKATMTTDNAFAHSSNHGHHRGHRHHAGHNNTGGHHGDGSNCGGYE